MGKKEKTHKLLTDTAIDLFIRKRSSNVSLDEVADAADVARRTLYYHFNSKEALIMEITEPILNDGLNYLEDIGRQDVVQMSHIADLCLFLWNRYGLSLNLLYNIDFEDFQDLKKLHLKYLKKYIEIFNRVSDLPSDLQNNKVDIASLVFRCFVPILSKIETMENRERRFRNSLQAMIQGLSLN